MKRNTIKLVLVLVLAFSLLLTVACGATQTTTYDSKDTSAAVTQKTEETTKAEETKKEPVTVKFVTGGDLPSAGLDEMIKLYEQKSGNTVENSVLPKGNDYETVLRTRVATKDFPDVVYYFGGIGHTWMKSMENCVDLTNEPCVQNMTDACKQALTWSDGKSYGTAFGGVNFIGVLYNKAVFEKAGITAKPKNYADFLNICETLKSKGILPIYEAAKDAWPVQVFTLSAWSSFVDPVIGDAGIAKIRSNQLKVTEIPQVTDMFKRQVELKTKGYLNKDLMAATVEKQYENIATGKCAMVFQVGFVLGDINSKYPDGMKDLGFFPIPSDNDEGIAGVYTPNQLFAFKTDNADASKDFINTMVSTDGLQIWYKANPAISAYKNFKSENLFAPSQDFVTYVDAGKAKPMVQVEIPSPRFLDYDKITQSLIIGAITPEEATKQMADSIMKDGKASKLPGFEN
jgi:raffinose/stachyose/melibiose transport system substrate-binding protein